MLLRLDYCAVAGASPRGEVQRPGLFKVLANKCCTVRATVGTCDEAEIALANGAEGIGLDRTEPSVVDLTFLSEKPISIQTINEALKAAADGAMKGILGFTAEELVSSDFRGNPLSSIVDSKLTKSVGMVGKVIAWYDNEWAYSSRVRDLALLLARKGL